MYQIQIRPRFFKVPVVALRPDANCLKRTGWSFYLFLAFHVRLYGYGLASVIERKGVVGTLQQRKAAHIENSRHHVGYAPRNIIFGSLLLVVFEVAFFKNCLTARVIVGDHGFTAVRALFGVLQQLVGAQALGVQIGIKAVLHPIEQLDHAAGVGGDGYVLFRSGALNPHGR